MPPNINEQEAVVLLRCLKHTDDVELSRNESGWADDLIKDGFLTQTIDEHGELLITNDAGVRALRVFFDRMNGDVPL
jgi:hypothetical protein